MPQEGEGDMWLTSAEKYFDEIVPYIYPWHVFINYHETKLHNYIMQHKHKVHHDHRLTDYIRKMSTIIYYYERMKSRKLISSEFSIRNVVKEKNEERYWIMCVLQ